ncbi:MAG TPA: hypothetical protein VLB09_08725, partial [Nitrospiria bacterium]|nr:hypothetical protein [Nitrospiria bacterium]
MRVYGFRVFIVVLLAGFFATPASAYVPYLYSDTAVPVERGKSRLDFTVGFEKWSLKPRETRYIFDTELSYGLINNLEFTVQVPYVVRDPNGKGSRSGLGDLNLKAKIRFIKGRAANPVSMSGMILLKFPGCDEDKGLTPECTGETDLGIKGIASKEFFPVTMHLNLGFIVVGNPPNSSLDDVFAYGLAFDMLTRVEFLHAVAELSGETNRDPDAKSDPHSLLIGLLYDIDIKKSVSLAADFGLT